jgi:hypothetical protein
MVSTLKVNTIKRQSGTTITIGESGDTITIAAGAAMGGSGASLTALNATELTSGTVPDARFPATLPVASGVNLTALNATNLGSGTLPDARFPATLPAASGVNLTALDAANIGSNKVPTARLGSGTASSTTYLAGDQTYKALSEYDDNQIQSNIAVLGFKVAVNGSLVKYNLVDQAIDEYEDASGVDASASTNEVRNTNNYYSGGSASETITATGGGGGGSRNSGVQSGLAGGSGGGGATNAAVSGGAGTANQGNDGGDGIWGATTPASGGGGGATGAGGDQDGSGGGGDGGAGATEGSSTLYDWTLADGTTATFDIDGTGNGFAGGGGGSGTNTGGGATQGGGAGATGLNNPGGDGTDGTGAGGGGGEGDGGDGGNGVVIFRYLTSAGTATGDADSTGTTGSYNWAKFTTSGDFITDFSTNIDILVVAGGGGGGSDAGSTDGSGAGGGAGGLKYFSQRTTASGTFTVVIGAGGAGSTTVTARGVSGADTTVDAPGNIQDMTLISNDTTAESEPDSSDMVMLIENAAGTATLNTDIKGYISRDSGSNFTQGTLVDEGTWGTNKKILAFHDLDISSQPSGTSMCYKIETLNQSGSKETRIYATSIGWR